MVKTIHLQKRKILNIQNVKEGKCHMHIYNPEIPIKHGG